MRDSDSVAPLRKHVVAHRLDPIEELLQGSRFSDIWLMIIIPHILPFCLKVRLQVMFFINSYLRGRFYLAYGAGSPTDRLQAWTSVLWNTLFRRELPWG